MTRWVGVFAAVMTKENHATKQACEIPTIMVKMDGNSMSLYPGGWLGRAEPRRFIVQASRLLSLLRAVATIGRARFR